jgi:hypothetical protein
MVPLSVGGAISTSNRGAEVIAMVAKKLTRNLAAMKLPMVGALAINMAENTTPAHPKQMVNLRPRQSAIQVNNAPHIWPIW